MSQTKALTLTLRQKRTCELAWVEGMSDADIAAAHGIATRTVQTRLYRARRRMREAGLEPPQRRLKVLERPLQLGEIQNV